MDRRQFLTASATAVLTAAAPIAAAQKQPGDSTSRSTRQWIEIRTYHFSAPDKQSAFEKFLAASGVPAFHRAGGGPVGLFRVLKSDNPKLNLTEDSTDLWLVIPFDSADAVAQFEPKLLADAEYQSAGKEILGGVKEAAPFTRYESMLLIAFEGFPRLRPPPVLKPERVLEMRTYENPNQERAASKISMFNNGEIPLFEKAGMAGVFWGSALAGPDLPQLTYMICHDSIEKAPQDWKAFGTDPDWNKMKNEAQYKDNVSKIINRFLRPSPGSEI